MVLVSITRLRVRSFRFMPSFFWQARGAIRQVSEANGFISGSLLPDRRFTFWTMTLWRDHADMRAYMTSGFHGRLMPRLFGWCDEASVVHWDQDDGVAPDWLVADMRMRTEGRPSTVSQPSPGHQDMSFDAPRIGRTVPIVRRGS